jgi:hypothetical protein
MLPPDIYLFILILSILFIYGVYRRASCYTIKRTGLTRRCNAHASLSLENMKNEQKEIYETGAYWSMKNEISTDYIKNTGHMHKKRIGHMKEAIRFCP